MLPQTPNHRPPIAGEELYPARLALNHRRRGEVIRPPLLANGGLSSLTNGGNVRGLWGSGTPPTLSPSHVVYFCPGVHLGGGVRDRGLA